MISNLSNIKKPNLKALVKRTADKDRFFFQHFQKIQKLAASESSRAGSEWRDARMKRMTEKVVCRVSFSVLLPTAFWVLRSVPWRFSLNAYMHTHCCLQSHHPGFLPCFGSQKRAFRSFLSRWEKERLRTKINLTGHI